MRYLTITTNEERRIHHAEVCNAAGRKMLFPTRNGIRSGVVWPLCLTSPRHLSDGSMAQVDLVFSKGQDTCEQVETSPTGVSPVYDVKYHS